MFIAYDCSKKILYNLKKWSFFRTKNEEETTEKLQVTLHYYMGWDYKFIGLSGVTCIIISPRFPAADWDIDTIRGAKIQIRSPRAW